MDNNYPQRPRKRITKEIARKRQLTALAIVGFIVLLIIILIAKGCSKDDKKDKDSKSSSAATTTTTTAAVTQEPVTVPTTITEPTTEQQDTGDFKMKKYTYQLEIGERETAWIEGYPVGTTEADEVWSSDDESVAVVDIYGHITAVGSGECYVTVSSAVDPTKETAIHVKVFDNSGSNTPNTPNGNNDTGNAGNAGNVPADNNAVQQ